MTLRFFDVMIGVIISALKSLQTRSLPYTNRRQLNTCYILLVAISVQQKSLLKNDHQHHTVPYSNLLHHVNKIAN